MELIIEEDREIMEKTLSEDFLFNNYLWYKTLKEGLKNFKVGFIKKGGLVFPFGYKKRLNFYSLYFSPLTTPYIFKEEINPEIFFERFKNIFFIEMVDFENKLNLSGEFTKIITFHHYIDLEKEINLIRKYYRKSLREQIRQAQRKGVIFRKMKGVDLNRFYDVYKKLTVSKFKRKPYPLSFIQSIFTNLVPKKAEGFIAEVKGRIVTGVVCLHVKKDFSLAFIQGTDPSYYSYRVSPFIFDKIIEYYKDKNFKIFSFGLTPSQSRGTLFFKETFGCEKYYFNIWRFTHPLYKLWKRLF